MFRLHTRRLTVKGMKTLVPKMGAHIVNLNLSKNNISNPGACADKCMYALEQSSSDCICVIAFSLVSMGLLIALGASVLSQGMKSLPLLQVCASICILA